MKMNLRMSFLLALAVAVLSGVCFSGEIKRAKVGDYEYSYYVETNGTAVIGRYRDFLGFVIPDVKGADFRRFLSAQSAIVPSPGGKLVLPSSIDGHRVSAIEMLAFAGCGELEEVVIPDGVEYIGEDAFVVCSNLVDVVLPVSLTAIKDGAFQSCYRLRKIVLPQGIKEVGESALNGCFALDFIRIPASLEVPDGLCKNLMSLRSAYFDDGVMQIPESFFANCEDLETVRLPKSLKSIGPGAFDGCTSLSSLDLPEGMEVICDEAFKDCARLETITIPPTVTTVYASAFSGTPMLSDEGPAGAIVKDGWTLGWRGLKELDVVLGSSSNKVAQGAYHLTHTPLNITIAEDLPCKDWDAALAVLWRNTNVVKVVIKAPLKNLEIGCFEVSAFGACSDVEEIELPDTITNISRYCFSSCTKLKKIKMPKDFVARRPGLLSKNLDLLKSLAYEDDRSFFAAQVYLLRFYRKDLIELQKSSSRQNSYPERFNHVLARARQYVEEHPNCYTKEMYDIRVGLNNMLTAVWMTARENAKELFYARYNLMQLCEIFAKAYDLPRACKYLMEYCIDKDETLKRVDYYKRMARHEARFQRIFPKGSDEYASSHRDMLEYLQAISDLGYDRQAQMLQLELEREIVQEPADKSIRRSSTGTGWFVNKKCVATCWHVLEGTKRVRVELSDGRQAAAKVVAKDVANDVAVLEVENPPAGQVSLPIRSRGVKLSDKVFTVGYPLASLLGQNQKYTEGSISAMSGITGDGRYFQISTPIQPGNSGGALVDEKGCVIGLTSAMLNAIKTAQATGTIPQNVNYAIKVRYLAAILEDAGIDYGTEDRGRDASRESAVERAMKATCLIIAE